MASSERGVSKAEAGKFTQRTTRKLTRMRKKWRIRKILRTSIAPNFAPAQRSRCFLCRPVEPGTTRSAEVIEVEVDGDGIAFGRIYFDGGGAGAEVFGGEIKLESGTGEGAAAILRTDIVRLA